MSMAIVMFVWAIIWFFTGVAVGVVLVQEVV